MTVPQEKPQNADQVGRLIGGWAGRLPISLSWRRNWARITPVFDYPLEIRTVIDTTNTIDSINMSLRKVTKTHASFSSDEAVSKWFYFVLNNLSQKWTIPIRDCESSTASLHHSVRRPAVAGLNDVPFTQYLGHPRFGLRDAAEIASLNSAFTSI